MMAVNKIMAVNMIMAVLEPNVTVVDLKLSSVAFHRLGDRNLIVNIRHQTSDGRVTVNPGFTSGFLDNLDHIGKRIARTRRLQRRNF